MTLDLGSKVGGHLDLLSTSQTLGEIVRKGNIRGEALEDLNIQREAVAGAQSDRCPNGAPFIFFVDGQGRGRIAQGCCNSWTCDRCGHIRALHEYGRIVNGAHELNAQGTKLYFLTITCRGKECSLDEAEADYGKWTNRFLTNARKRCKKQGDPWSYAQVTERQKRLLPHSHFATSFCPDDAQPFAEGSILPNGRTAKHDCLWSEWLRAANVAAGLGIECDLSAVREAVAVAIYQAKYMFKSAMTTEWPRGWRRVRYSQSWPQLPRQKAEVAFPLVHYSDWLKMAALEMTVYADSAVTLEAAYARQIMCVTLAQTPLIDTRSH